MFPTRAFLLAVLAFGSLGGGPASAEPRDDAHEHGQIAALAAGPAAPDHHADHEADAPPGGARGGCDLVPRFSEDVGFHGPITGEAEKDSVGFLLLGHDGCPGAPIR